MKYIPRNALPSKGCLNNSANQGGEMGVRLAANEMNSS